MTTTAYKIFDADWRCRDFHYELGKTYTHDKEIKLCQSGFHACLSPFDCWSYYDVWDSKYAIVECDGQMDMCTSDSKIVAKSISIKTELTFNELVTAGVDYIINQTRIGSSGSEAQIGSTSSPHARIGSSDSEAQIGSSGDAAQIGSSGDAAQIGSSGFAARIGSSGSRARIGSSGSEAQIGSSGFAARIGSSGDAAKIGSSGDAAKIGSSGSEAQIGSSGEDAQIISNGNKTRIGTSGDFAHINITGAKNVVASAGLHTRVKGVKGTWISLAETDQDGNCVGFVTGCIGQDGLQPDTWYKAQNGCFVEAI